jgi:hypothetical protein
MSVPVVVPDASVLLKWVLPSEDEPDADKALMCLARDLRADSATFTFTRDGDGFTTRGRQCSWVPRTPQDFWASSWLRILAANALIVNPLGNDSINAMSEMAL